MKNFGVEKRANPESREEPAASGTSSRSSSTQGGKKLRFDKLWVCKRGSNPPISRIGKSAPRRASDVLQDLEGIEKNGGVSTEERFSQTYFDCNSTIDASTETIDTQLKKATADVGVSCRCETTSASCGPDEFVEIRRVNHSRSSAVQTDACAESARSKRDKRGCNSILSEGSSAVSPEELLEAGEDIEADLIYDGMKRCFPYPIEVTVKPKYVATCESCESSTDKGVSISHGGLDAAVGSSIIIIDASLEKADGRRVSIDETYQRSVSCEVCDDCVELEESSRSTAWQSVDETRRSSRDESGRKNRQRRNRDTSVDDKSVRNSDFVDDGDFGEALRDATHDDTAGSADRRGSRSAGRRRGSSSGERRSGRSRTHGEEDSRFQDENSTFWEKSSRLEDREQLDDIGGSRSARGRGRSSSGDRRSGRSKIYDEENCRFPDESSNFWKESTSSWFDDRQQHDTGGSRSARRHARTSSGDRRSGRSRIHDEEHSRLSDESSSSKNWLDDREQHDDTGRSRSARGYERGSSGEKKFGRSRIHDEEPSRLPDESSTIWKEKTSDWLDDNDRRRSALVPLHESSRFSLGTVEKTGKNLRPSGQRMIDPTVDAKLIETSTRSKKPYSLPGRETNARTDDFEEIILRRRKPRTSETPIARFRGFDDKEPIFGCKRHEPFVFEIRKFTKPAPVTSEFRELVPKNCKISEFNNFGKLYDWDRSLDPVDRRKYCKCGNGCGGSISGNKCCCHE